MQDIYFYTAPVKFLERDLLSTSISNFILDKKTTWISQVGVKRKSDFGIILPKVSYIHFKVWLYYYELKKYYYRKNRFLFSKKIYPYLGLSSISIIILRCLIFFRIGNVVERFLYYVYKLLIKHYRLDLKADVLIAFSYPNDLYYDILTQKLRTSNPAVKILMIPINWDNATSKPFVFLPDTVFTWGYQSSVLASFLHGVDSRPIGSMRLENYFQNESNLIDQPKKRLSLEDNVIYFLFAGSSFGFDEIEALNILSEEILFRNLNIRIIYRRHPKGSSKYFSEPSNCFNNVVLEDPTLKLFDSEDITQYEILFRSIEALITPFSTMMVEAAYFGVPSLCLGYNSRTMKGFSWELNARSQPHLSFIYSQSWVLTCYNKDELKSKFNQLVLNSKNVNVKNEAKSAFDKLVYRDTNSYTQRLINIINQY